MTGEEIRGNWYKALESQDRISSKIEWAFTYQDLYVLCCFHEAGIFREKIEDLLEDCNFHTECGLLAEGKYDECRNVITKDMKGDWE